MDDLISRSRAIENIWDVFNSYANDSLRFDEYETEAINNAFKVLQKVIEGQPTAYDIEKIIAELKSSNYKKSYKSNGKNTYKTIKAISKNKAIDITKKGGME